MPALLPFEPNWAQPVVVAREYKTEIIESRNLREQRKALRAEPRRRFEFTVQNTYRRADDIWQFLEARIQDEFVMPDFTRVAFLSVGAAATSTVLTVPGADTIPWLVASGQLVVGAPPTGVLPANQETVLPGMEVVDVVSVSGDIVTVSALTESHAAGARVRPPVYGRLDQNVGGNMVAVSAGEWPLVFIEDPSARYRESYVSPASDRFFDGREVFLEKPNWAERADAGVTGYLETLDMGRGVLSHRHGQAFNHRLWAATYRGMSTASVERLIQFVHRQRGRQGEFWLPTWRRDLRPVFAASAGATFLTVEGQSELHRPTNADRVMIAHSSGDIEFHEIVNRAPDGENTRLTLRDPLTESVSPGGTDRISHMPLYRLATDRLTLSYSVTSSADAKISMQEVNFTSAFEGFYFVAEEDYDDVTSAPVMTLPSSALLSTDAIAGRARFQWTRTATVAATGDDAAATLYVRVRCRTASNALVSDVTLAQFGNGLISLDDFVDIPQNTANILMNWTAVASAGGTSFSESTIKNAEVRGRL